MDGDVSVHGHRGIHETVEGGPGHDAGRGGLEYCRQHRNQQFEWLIAREAAGLEALHGQLEHGPNLSDSAIDRLHQAGDVANLPATIEHLRTVLSESRFDECVAEGEASRRIP